MAAPTQRLKLPNPDPGKLNWDEDWYSLTEILDKNPGISVVTSSNKPDNAWVGQVIYVEDMKSIEVFDGTEFVAIGGGGGGGIESMDSSQLPADADNGTIVYLTDIDNLVIYGNNGWYRIDEFRKRIYFDVNADNYDIDDDFDDFDVLFGRIESMKIADGGLWLDQSVKIKNESGLMYAVMPKGFKGARDAGIFTVLSTSIVTQDPLIVYLFARYTGHDNDGKGCGVYIDFVDSEFGVFTQDGSSIVKETSEEKFFDPDTWYQCDLNVYEDNIKFRIWGEFDGEPTDPQIDYTDSKILGFGNFGLMSDTTHDVNVEEFSIFLG